MSELNRKMFISTDTGSIDGDSACMTLGYWEQGKMHILDEIRGETALVLNDKIEALQKKLAIAMEVLDKTERVINFMRSRLEEHNLHTPPLGKVLLDITQAKAQLKQEDE